MKVNVHITISILVLKLILLAGICGCQDNEVKFKVDKIRYKGVVGNQIEACEQFIPHSDYDTNYIVIWRTGSIYYSDYTSCLIIDKKQLAEAQIKCHYLTFESEMPSKYGNWKLAKFYQVTIENQPFNFPLKARTGFEIIDSLCFECNCEGIKANVYFLKEFYSNEVYPVHNRYNSTSKYNVEMLFKQISRKEHVQTLSLSEDSIDYQFVSKIIKADSVSYCLDEDARAKRGL